MIKVFVEQPLALPWSAKNQRLNRYNMLEGYTWQCYSSTVMVYKTSVIQSVSQAVYRVISYYVLDEFTLQCKSQNFPKRHFHGTDFPQKCVN